MFYILLSVLKLKSALASISAKEWKRKNLLSVRTQASFHILFSTFGWEVRVKNCQTQANNTTRFFFVTTLYSYYRQYTMKLPLLETHFSIMATVLSRAVETKGFSLPSQDNHRLHPPLDFAAPYSTWSRKMKPRCMASGITHRPVCSAQQRKLICNLQWRQLNLSLLPLKSSSVQSCFICFGGETKPIFRGSMLITFWYKMKHLARLLPWIHSDV